MQLSLALEDKHLIAYDGADVAMLAAQKCKADEKYAGQSLFWSQLQSHTGRVNFKSVVAPRGR